MVLVDGLGNVVLAIGLLLSLWVLVRSADVRAARLQAAKALIAALSVKVASSVLNTILISDWDSIASAAIIVLLRLVISAETRRLAWKSQEKVPT